MMTIEEKRLELAREIAAINEKLTAIEDAVAWLIKPDLRFRIGQRVEWSRSGRRAGFPYRKKAQRGTVKGIGAFMITVKMDSMKRESSFHHAFFNPVSGPKLF